MSYGDDSQMIFARSVADIMDAATSPLKVLFGERQDAAEKARPIVFISP